MIIRSTRGFFYSVSALTLVALAGSPALAQDAQTSGESKTLVLDTLVITGEKVARDIKNTASSVTVISAKEIAKEKTGDSSVSEAVRGTPNVVYTDTVGAPVIRGQDTQGPHNGQNVFWGGTVPRATINVDGHYLNYNEYYYGGTSIWDVNNIEVFRGPQTTSQGANAIAGTIIVNTNDPTFEREGAYQVEIGNYNSKRSSIMLNSPIYKDELAARLAVDYSGRDTFIDYISPNFQSAGTDQDFSALTARLKLLWEPAEIPGLVTKLTYSHARSNRPSQEAASAPFDELEHLTTSMPSWKQDTNTGILDISYDFDNGIKFYNQTQFSASAVHRHTGTPTNGKADINQKNISNEARITFGEQEDIISGVAGIFYANTKSDEILLLQGTTSFDDTKENLGLFAEASYRITDQWTLTGGLRFQQDSIQRIGQSALTTRPLNYDETFSAVLPKISLAYAVTPDLTVGAMVSKGYNPGGVSLNLSSRQWHPFEEEELWNYELFTRADLLDNKLTLTSNLFYMDFKNAQYNIPVVLPDNLVQSYTINAEKAHSYGLELGLDYQVLDNLALKTSAGILRTEIDEISSNSAYEGKEFAKSPGYMFSIGASWDATEKLNLSGQVRHTDGYYSDIANTQAYVVDAYTIADARVSYDFHESLELYGYVKNIFDERTPTYLQQNRGIGGLEASMTMPRTFGVGIKGSF
ncbi:TonB-dependent receptor [Brucella grignonensis]|uniref:Heme transporter BhuA n=1 Tax=Brucella grignonensis TaxID=94627 RepID=A0A256FNQ9_9HYPH|nr:TonB-dependent receptor [Brucella grignonensis]OYR16388.1 tonB dependent receptor family protein [Brucella grignonensis]